METWPAASVTKLVQVRAMHDILKACIGGPEESVDHHVHGNAVHLVLGHVRYYGRESLAPHSLSFSKVEVCQNV